MRILGIPTSKAEIRDLIKAWVALSIAFGIIINSNYHFSLYYSFPIALVTVGIGFIFHEMGHKFMAQKYHCWAEFRSYDPMLVLAIIFSFFGFVFAAPGAVMISGYIGVERNGKVSLAGPLMNYMIAAAFLPMVLLTTGIIQTAAGIGFTVNSFLGLFNMIPLGNFDGVKIFRWNRGIYAAMVIFGIMLILVTTA